MMLKRMILINSANFQFADIDLSKEVFFVGDNASGKTTTTRAIHFLYNGNGSQLNIPSSKNSFSKHYFAHDDSYIIYVFESFFIFTYKKNDSIKRWFSKQEFDIDAIIKDGNLVEFNKILEYIKKAPLKYNPKSIEEYTNILYGQDKAYLDFAIAKIDNYKIFLEVYNMIFKVDEAIVTASNIKEAIQKSLDRKDEVLNIDYDDFIRKLNEFSRAYNFFKTFDSNRDNLSNAINIKDKLIDLEQKITSNIKAINYKYKIELSEYNTLEQKKIDLKNLSESYKKKSKKLSTYYARYEKRVKNKIDELHKEIMRLEALKEEFDSLEVEKNITLASQFESLEKELDSKKFDLKRLKEDFSQKQKIVEKQIEEIEYKIKITIPNEFSKKLYDLSEVEKHNYEEEVLSIENDYIQMETKLNDEIKELEKMIDDYRTSLKQIEIKIADEIKKLQDHTDKHIKTLRIEKKTIFEEKENFEKTLRNLKNQKELKDNELRKHNQKYTDLRSSNAKNLSTKRKSLNQKIANAKAILYPMPNSFNEFLSNEIEDWESEIYPIIDKKLLLKSCDELKPVKVDSDISFGFSIDVTTLEKIPTKDEAIQIIKKTKYEKSQTLKNAKIVYKEEIVKLDETKNKIIADLESIEVQISNNMKSISSKNLEIEQIEYQINELENSAKKDIEELHLKYDGEKNTIYKAKEEFEQTLKTKKTKEVLALKTQKKAKLDKQVQDRDKNIEILKQQLNLEQQQAIQNEKQNIESLKLQIKNSETYEIIASMTSQVNILQEKYNSAYDAKKYLEKYEQNKEKILQLPLAEKRRNSFELQLSSREKLVSKIDLIYNEKIENISKDIENIIEKIDIYAKGLKKYKQIELEKIEGDIENTSFLFDLITNYEDKIREYQNEKSKFRSLIDKLKKIEKHSIIEINFNNDRFDDISSIEELKNILESLDELENFEKNKYNSEKKRRHNDFKTFLTNTVPTKLQSFDDLEIDFERAKNAINKSLSNADFGVIRDIRLETDFSKKRNDSIAQLMQLLSLKVSDTVKLYAQDSLFYFDISKSVDNISEIQHILEEIKQKASNGMINLFDTIDLGISYIENGKKIENKQNIKDDSSSGGNIILKVAIAISILNRYAKQISSESPFFLIVDEISKLQIKNQLKLQEYINSNGFKTLFITPDPAYPDPQKAIYYTFKNIEKDGESLDIRQMNIV